MEMQLWSEDKIQKGREINFHKVMDTLPSSLDVVAFVLDKIVTVVPCMPNVHPSHSQQAFSVKHQSAAVG